MIVPEAHLIHCGTEDICAPACRAMGGQRPSLLAPTRHREVARTLPSPSWAYLLLHPI